MLGTQGGHMDMAVAVYFFLFSTKKSLEIDFKEKINFYWLGLILVEIIKVKLKQLINPIIGSSWR